MHLLHTARLMKINSAGLARCSSVGSTTRKHPCTLSHVFVLALNFSSSGDLSVDVSDDTQVKKKIPLSAAAPRALQELQASSFAKPEVGGMLRWLWNVGGARTTRLLPLSKEVSSHSRIPENRKTNCFIRAAADFFSLRADNDGMRLSSSSGC